MRKALLLICLLAVSAVTVYAQSPKIEISAPFDEPDDGWNKLLQVKNGNTLFFHFSKKGIAVVVYDKSRKIASEQTITSELWEARKLRGSTINGLYEINGEAVLFLTQIVDRSVTLYRLRINTSTGTLIEEKVISSIEQYKAGARWAMIYGGVDPNGFYVEKDPLSDAYAVVSVNSFAHESGERIKLSLYNGTHQELSKLFYGAPGSFKYIKFISMAVNDKEAILCAYGFNTEASGGKDSKIILSRVKNRESAFEHQLLDFTDDFRATTGIMQYNPGSHMVQLLTLTLTSSKSQFFTGKTTSYYLPLLSYIDPETLSIAFTKPVLCEKAGEYIATHFNNKEAYSGVPQNMVINKDYSTTIITEELTQKTLTDSRTGAVMSQQTALGNIGISEMDNAGVEKEGYGITKSQLSNGLIASFNQAEKTKGIWTYQQVAMMQAKNNHFLSFDYVSTEKNKYILFNDVTENFEKSDKEKKKTIIGISDCNTLCYKLGDNKVEKAYLFGKPKDDDHNMFCYIQSSNYMKETNTYATLTVERNRRDKQSRIIWATFE